MKLSIIIPNFNGLNLLKDNLPRVISEVTKNLKPKEFEVIVIDDHSSDESVTFLRDFFKENKFTQVKHKLLQNKKNIGFAASVNLGISKAGGDVMLLLNTDVYPEKNFLPTLLSHFKDEKVFAVGCLDKSIENGDTVLRGRGLGEWSRGFLVHRAGSVDKKNTLWVSGGSGAFKKSIWDKLGGFNELFSPFYWEDIDICYRALKSGYSVIFEPKSIVVHEHERGSIRSLFSPSAIRAIAYRNQFIFVWENVTDFGIILSHILWLPFHLIAALLRLDLRFITGFLKAVLLMPKIMEKRKIYRKNFTSADRSIAALFD